MRQVNMAKVFSVVPIELREGIQIEDFVKFWHEEYGALGARKLGWKSYVLKGDRGERSDKYAILWEISDVESRDRVDPGTGITEEALALLGPEFPILNEKLDKFLVDWPYTDYIEIC
jgi:hypothetical protein